MGRDVSKIPKLIERWVLNARGRLHDGARDERGAVAVIFAVSLVLLAPLILGAIDVYMSSNQRARLQDALDAAALYAARSTAATSEEIAVIGLRALNANLTEAERAKLVSTSFTLSDTRIVASAAMAPETLASDLWNHGNLSASTEVVRSSNDVEVSLVLDITGSMSGTKITDLKAAATELVDIVVQDAQTPFYSKMAIVPYSNSVNVGSYAASLRGAVPAAKGMTGATRANPVTVTSASHGFLTGAKVWINGVNGMTQLNNKLFTVASPTTNTFRLSGVDGSGYNSYSSGGSIYCTTLGCGYYNFTNASGSSTTFPISTCVSERTGAQKYTDASPSSAPVGRVYDSTENPCPSATIVPLTSDKASLKSTIGSLAVGGSTAGHIGLAWGWYLVSPNFGYLWPSISQPAAYSASHLLKVVILMTDGAFNTAYCNGVIAKDSGSGSGSASKHINCNATNGSAFSQAQSLCSAMKAQGIIIYTVGFDVGSDVQAQSIMNSCATDAGHVYLPSSGEDLQTAFRAIGQDINSLRLAH